MSDRKAMKSQLLLLNAVSIAAFLAWLGFQALMGLSRAFGNANPSAGPGDISWVFVVVGIVGAGCMIYSFFAPAGKARLFALAPMGLILAGQVLITWQESARRARFAQKEFEARKAQQRRIEALSRDYVLTDDGSFKLEGREFFFLTVDREFNSIVEVDAADTYQIRANIVGRIDGKHLDTFHSDDDVRKLYGHYLDLEGKSVFDRYTLRHRPDQKYDFSELKKYQP